MIFENKKFDTSNTGLIISKAKIVKIEDQSGQDNGYGTTFDRSLVIHLDIGKEKEFFPKVYVAGNFAKDENGQVKGIGSCFRVQQFFSDMNVSDNFTDEHPIPSEWLEQCLGMEVLTLRYKGSKGENGSTETKWRNWYRLIQPHDWNNPSSIRMACEYFDKTFRDQCKKGYPKDFQGGDTKIDIEDLNLEFPPAEEEENRVLLNVEELVDDKDPW